jgi:trk system potassium uptake protein TrkH
LIFVPDVTDINIREGLLIVVLGWTITCLVGALPYIMWGGEFTPINAWFESVSGFTTTGSTILKDIEALPLGLLFWRSSTHFIGGIGIILFSMLILPESASTRFVLLNAEMSDLAKSNFKYRAKQTVQILAVVYVGLTILETLLLLLADMSLFDAVNHTFATIATGGFSTKNNSIAYYDSLSVEIIIIIFMIISGIHFGFLFDTIVFKKLNIFRSTIVRYYVIILTAGIFLVTLKLYTSDFGNFSWSLRYAAFQVASLGTTTGFATIDTGNWPFFVQMILIYFTIQCACVGSTSGGLKFDRVFLFLKMIGKQIKNIIHPRAVFVVKIDGKTIPEQIENHTLVFIILYLLIIFISTLIVSAMNVDLLTAFSGAIATIGNVGPGFSSVSSMSNFGSIPDFGKFIYTLNMLLGRLEIFSIIAIFVIRK